MEEVHFNLLIFNVARVNMEFHNDSLILEFQLSSVGLLVFSILEKIWEKEILKKDISTCFH